MHPQRPQVLPAMAFTAPIAVRPAWALYGPKDAVNVGRDQLKAAMMTQPVERPL